jgi:hypothetical protein
MKMWENMRRSVQGRQKYGTAAIAAPSSNVISVPVTKYGNTMSATVQRVAGAQCAEEHCQQQ